MRFVVFTPVGIRSAIAKVTLLVARQLEALGHDVDVVATEAMPLQHKDVNAAFGATTHWHDEAATLALVRQADAVWHQVGNNYDFHAGSIHWLPRVHGIVSLHDYFLGGLLAGWAGDGHRDAAGDILGGWYGQTLEWFEELVVQSRLESATWPKYTFSEWIVVEADAVIAHSDLALPALLAATGGPVEVLPLPYSASVDTSLADPEIVRDDGRKTVLTFGGINENKAADLVIAAISADPATSAALEYRLVGSISEDMRSRLTSLAEIVGVRLSVVGQVSDARLGAELANADLVCCLRIPSLESASATAIESMLWSKTTIVADTGFYATIPDDVVLKVSLEHTVDDLGALLDDFAAGRLAVDGMGERARLYAESTYVADAYAVEVVSLAAKTHLHRAEADIVRAVSTQLGEWNAQLTPSLRASLDDALGLFR
jgi:glycosyltransferase involved in cell wall biosynthesis